MPFSYRDKAACAEREAQIRRRVYPGRVNAGRMTQWKATREIALMDEIAADMRRAAETEKLL